MSDKSTVLDRCKKCFHFQVCANIMKNQLFIRESILGEENPECGEFISSEDIEKYIKLANEEQESYNKLKIAEDTVESLKAKIELYEVERKHFADMRRNAYNSAVENFAEDIYKFICDRNNWNHLKSSWLENGECYWLKYKLEGLVKGRLW